jgi:uncharacterized protein YjbI with pentapeptide repeats
MSLFDKHITDKILDNYISIDYQYDTMPISNMFSLPGLLIGSKFVNFIKIDDKVIFDEDELTFDSEIHNMKIYPNSDLVSLSELIETDRLTIIKIDFSHYIDGTLDTLFMAFSAYMNLKEIVFGKAFKNPIIKSLYCAFSGCESLEKIDFTGVNFSNCEDFSCAFIECKNLKTIIFDEKLNTKMVTDFHQMFSGCTKLEEIIGFDKFNFTGVDNVSSMFFGCESLKKIHFNNPNFSRLNFVTAMFNNCKNLEEVTGLENANFWLVSRFDYMFANCENLKNIDLSQINFTSIGCSFEHMFDNCKRLENVNINNLKVDKQYIIDNNIDYNDMLSGVNPNIKIISNGVDITRKLKNLSIYGTIR